MSELKLTVEKLLKSLSHIKNVWREEGLVARLARCLNVDEEELVDILYDVRSVTRYLDDRGDVLVIGVDVPQYLIIDVRSEHQTLVRVTEVLDRQPRYGVVVDLANRVAVHKHIDGDDELTDVYDIIYVVDVYDGDAAAFLRRYWGI